MNFKGAKKLVALACVVVLSLGLLAGCSSPAGKSATPEVQANRAYMSSVNGIMEDLGGQLELFVDAVSRNDIVNMRTQADNAYKVLDRLESLDVPDELSDIHEKYLEGSGKLREALDSYIALYTEMSGDSFDWSTYDKRISEVQQLYDKGVKAFEAGDKTASEKEN